MFSAAGCGGSREQIQDVFFKLVDPAYCGRDFFHFSGPCDSFLIGKRIWSDNLKMNGRRLAQSTAEKDKLKVSTRRPGCPINLRELFIGIEKIIFRFVSISYPLGEPLGQIPRTDEQPP
jgi:hypothetical protein